MTQSVNIQDVFWNRVRKAKVSVTVYLVNGFQIRGKIIAFDNFCIIIDANGKQQLLYKHAISTCIPVQPVSLASEASGARTQKGT